jgi:hypothetical protein
MSAKIGVTIGRSVRSAADAYGEAMAAVLLLVFLPILAAVGFMFGAIGGHISFSTGFAAFVFLALGAGIVLGMVRMSRPWDGQEPH